jgi:hypothetical protein
MSAPNLLVFRGGQRRVSGLELEAALIEQLEQLCRSCSHEALLGGLLRAGELECGVADGASAGASIRAHEQLTDLLADALLLGESESSFQKFSPQNLINTARTLPASEQFSISTPEGFAYYALHPLAYADVLERISSPSCSLMVVGIRSIGTTLSAVMAAAARLRGITVRRITVRPHGHPYNRTLEFSPQELVAIEQAVSCAASFAIVDEGPGLSGSSFLSVAEALERAGAPRESITMVGSHTADADKLCASDAARRWRRFRCVPVAAEARRPARADKFVGGGQWRGQSMDGAEWPAVWTSFERLKYLSSSDENEPRFYKFAGFGHYGDRVFQRELQVAGAGFGPPPRRESDGFVSYPWIDGRPLCASDVSEAILARMAQYCAFRLRNFSVELAELNALQQMAEHNLHQLGLDLPVELRLERPVIADGRMQPHEWLLMRERGLLKADSGSHGDDHFFPGPTDIAWDLAGAIVEWRMDEQQGTRFIDLYRHASGDDSTARIESFIHAYAAFRSAYCLMAANAMAGSDEQPRLQRAATEYRALLMKSKNQTSGVLSSYSTAPV